MADVPSVENEQAMQLHDLLLAGKPEGAKHNADICPFCVEKASQTTTSVPPGPDVSESDEHQKGGATPTMNDTMISQETHEALVRQKIDDAVRQSDQALAAQTEKANEALARVAELETELDSVKTENSDLSSKLDEAQVKVNGLETENAQLKSDAAKAAEDKELAEKASERAKQVTNLKLFPEAHVTERASRWAKLSDEDWAEQLEDWKKLKPADGTVTTEGGDQASAMTGTDGDLTSTTDSASGSTPAGGETKTPARRLALGLK